MEFEIINDILTSTVSKIFPNTTKHLSYFRFEEEVHHRFEIPKSSKKENKNEEYSSASLSSRDRDRERDLVNTGIVTNINNFLGSTSTQNQNLTPSIFNPLNTQNKKDTFSGSHLSVYSLSNNTQNNFSKTGNISSKNSHTHSQSNDCAPTFLCTHCSLQLWRHPS